MTTYIITTTLNPNEQYITNRDEIPYDILHSYNDHPALQIVESETGIWYNNGKVHRETGPALGQRKAGIGYNMNYCYYLNNIPYNSLEEWLEQHPNQSDEFKNKMRQQYY